MEPRLRGRLEEPQGDRRRRTDRGGDALGQQHLGGVGARVLALTGELDGGLGAGRLHVECLGDGLAEHVRPRFRGGVLDDREPDPPVPHVREVAHRRLDAARRLQHELGQTGMGRVGDPDDRDSCCRERFRLTARVSPAQHDRPGDTAGGERGAWVQPVAGGRRHRDVAQREDPPVEGERERPVRIDVRAHQRVRHDGDERGTARRPRRRARRLHPQVAQRDGHRSAGRLRGLGPVAEHARHGGQGQAGGLRDLPQGRPAHRRTAFRARSALTAAARGGCALIGGPPSWICGR